MGISIGIFLLAVGAILAFAVDATLSGVDVNAVGVILMVVGAIGLVWGLLAASTIGPWRRADVPGERVRR